MSRTADKVPYEFDAADERIDMIRNRQGGYKGIIGYFRYLRDFWWLSYNCQKFRERCDFNRKLEHLPKSTWNWDLAQFWIDHHSVRLISADFGGNARDCGCDRWNGLHKKRKR